MIEPQSMQLGASAWVWKLTLVAPQLRVIGAALPPVQIVDLRHEDGYPLSAPLLQALGKVAENGEKAILLLNRRGVAPALHCRDCGATLRCENCDVALTLHGDGTLRCHHCGHSEPEPELCPVCQSAELARIGAGTQRLEKELAAAIPALARFRLDGDTVAERGVADTLRAFGEACEAEELAEAD